MTISIGLKIKGIDLQGNTVEGNIIKILKGFKQIIIQKQTNEYNNTCHVCFENILEILD